METAVENGFLKVYLVGRLEISNRTSDFKMLFPLICGVLTDYSSACLSEDHYFYNCFYHSVVFVGKSF